MTRGVNYTGDLITPDHSRMCLFCNSGTVTREPKCPRCNGEMHEWGASTGEPGMNWMCDNDSCRTRVLVLSDPDNVYATCDNDKCTSRFETERDYRDFSAETGVYGDETEDGHGERVAHGYVDPSWSMWQVDEDAPEEPHDVMDEDDAEDYSPVQWLAHKVTERLGAIDNWDSSGWFRQADEETNYTTGESITLNAHPVGFTPDEITEAARLIHG